MYKQVIKRILDFIVSFIILILCFPILTISILLLLIFNNQQVLFIQNRPGLKGKLFKLLKLKTMNEEKDLNGDFLPDNMRITKLGKFLRKTSLDELPQLINVLKGDMSLIGPRPLLTKYLLIYDEFQKRRHEVKPGLTGWAQINGRNAISWNERFELDVWYVDNISFVLDFKIFFLTIIKVISRAGVNNSESTPMETFTGN